MNISSIVLKGNDKGIRLIIANDASMKNILSDLENMFSRTSYCNQTNNEIKISFEGKVLTDQSAFNGFSYNPNKLG